MSLQELERDLEEVLANVALTPAGWTVRGRAVAGSAAPGRAVERGLADALYQHLYCRRLAPTRRRAPVGMAQVHDDQLRRCFRAVAPPGAYDHGDGGWRFFAPRAPAEGAPLVRVYWNLVAPGALRFVAAATRALATRDVPAHLKVLRDPDEYLRADAGVMYVPTSEWAGARLVVAEIVERVRDHLRPQRPMFTKELAPGVGLAEDLGDGTSFGAARCATLARVLLDMRDAGEWDVSSATARLAREGVRVDAIHLKGPRAAEAPATAWEVLA